HVLRFRVAEQREKGFAVDTEAVVRGSVAHAASNHISALDKWDEKPPVRLYGERQTDALSLLSDFPYAVVAEGDVLLPVREIPRKKRHRAGKKSGLRHEYPLLTIERERPGRTVARPGLRDYPIRSEASVERARNAEAKEKLTPPRLGEKEQLSIRLKQGVAE